MDCVKEKLKLARLDDSIREARAKLNMRRAELNLEIRKKEFDALPVKERRVHEMLGWSPYQRDKIVARVGGRITTK